MSKEDKTPQEPSKGAEETAEKEQVVEKVMDKLAEKLAEKPAPKTEEKPEVKPANAEFEKALAVEKEKAKQHWEQLLRKEAELQNVQRRAKLDVEKAHKFALERFAKELLQVVDSIEQGLSITCDKNAEVKDVLAGMELTKKVVLDVMEKEGITQIDPKGEPFDPNYHEALTVQESDIAPDHVIQVIQKGYLLNNRLLRPARVIVSKAKEETKEEPKEASKENEGAIKEEKKGNESADLGGDKETAEKKVDEKS